MSIWAHTKVRGGNKRAYPFSLGSGPLYALDDSRLPTHLRCSVRNALPVVDSHHAKL